MKTREEFRLAKIEATLKEFRRAYDEILPVFTLIDRRKKSIELNIHGLEVEANKIRQGQLVFDESADGKYDESMGF